MIARGTHSQLMAVFLSELKRMMTIRIIRPKKTGIEAASEPPARAESSTSPPQAIE